MAQKDIRAIADYMNALNESVIEENRAYDIARREADEFSVEEDELEDEIIDKSALGFIDDSSSDDLNEDDVDPYEEDISDCLPIDEEELDA